MKKHIAKFLTLSLVLSSVIVLSPAPNGVDVVSAATGETTNTTPTKPTTPSNPAAPGTTASASSAISHTLGFGSKGSEVKTLQTLLNNNGYNLKVDGIFGSSTKNAVANYQSKNGLSADGIVGPKTLAKLSPASTTAASALKLYQGLGQTIAFRNGPGKDSEDVQVYSFTLSMADATFDAEGRIVNVYIDAYEVSTPNYDGASMPHFSGWPGKEGYNVTDHATEKVSGVSVNTPESAAAEVNGWVTKRQRGDSYGMNPANEWYKQMDFYQKFFVGKTVAELEAWFAKNTTAAGRPIKATTTKADELEKLAKLTDTEKADLADVVAGATMSLRDPHGDFLGAVANAYKNRVEVTVPAK